MNVSLSQSSVSKNNSETQRNAPTTIVAPDPSSYQDYVQAVKKDVERIFRPAHGQTAKNLETFLKNADHWARHSFNVYAKACEIAERLEKSSGAIRINQKLLYLMATAHDSGRFHLSEKPKKQAKCERKHDVCGVAQVKLGNRSLKNAEGVGLNENDAQDLIDYVANHDYFNERLDGTKYREPASLEGQIVRLADRMSTDIKEEVQRYWETGKRLKTPYFVKWIPFEDRVNFSFRRVKDYVAAGKFDEFTFFLALISMSPSDFQHPRLAEIYAEWAKTKGEAVEEILKIAREEGYSNEDVSEMRSLIDEYAAHFKISLE